MNGRWMIYGANGYSGRLIAEQAVKQGLKPVLAGRNGAKLKALAASLACEACIFDLDNPEAMAVQLQDMDLLLNCAGPFQDTVRPLVTACLRTQTHYLDLSGELEVFEYCKSRDADAKQRGIILCPGVAFDVVPTESIALKLKQLLPDATELKLGFDGKMALSPGSTITLLGGIGNPDISLHMLRHDGALVKARAPRIEELAFESGGEKQKAMSLTWADLNAAFYSTAIPDIAVFIRATPINRLSFGYMNLMSGVFRIPMVQRMARMLVRSAVHGPSATEMEQSTMRVFGEASNAAGVVKRVYLRVPHGYKFTCLSALAFVDLCLQQEGKSGYMTPAQLAGPDFVQTIAGSSSFEIVE